MTVAETARSPADMRPDLEVANVPVLPRSFEHDDTTDADNAEHRRKAVQEHRKRALRQIVNAIVVVLLSALAPLYWLVALDSYVDPAALEEPLRSLAGLVPDSVMILPGATALATAALWLWLLLWYRRERDHDWAKNSARADARAPEQSAEGYMELFRLYARTKRWATFAMSYGVLSIWWAGLGISIVLTSEVNGDTRAGVLAIALFQLLAAFCVIYLGYDIGRRYLPGNVLVTRTLILSYLAISQSDYNDASAFMREPEARMIDKKPWWFYSYRVPRKKK